MDQALDLTKQPPRSPNEMLGGYKILARMIDKARSDINGTVGEYHSNCPVDNLLLKFKGLDYNEFRKFLEEGHNDQEVLDWVNAHGTPKTTEEIKEWSESVDDNEYHLHPQTKDWFVSECQKLGLDPETTSLFTYLETDDRASFPTPNTV